MADRTGSRLGDSGGFALAVAILALVLVAAVVAGGYFTASQEIRIGQGMKNVTRSFFAGESGVHRLLAGWNPAVFNTLAPGDSLVFDPEALEGRSTYRLRVFRVDDGMDPDVRYFYIEAAGRGPNPAGGERRQGALARVRFHHICCDAAMTITESLVVGSHSKIYGFNSDPWNWMNAGLCSDVSTADAPGIRTIVPDPVDDSQGDVRGDPPLVTDPALDADNVFGFDELTYADVAALADIELAHGTEISTLTPATDGSECDRSIATNWGAPEHLSHPCFNYFPIIHARGDLDLEGDGVGQGILLVDGDLDIDGQFVFHGIVLVQGRFQLRARGTIRGGVIVRGDSPDGSITEAPNARLELSRCAIDRAHRLSALGRPELLPQRAWVDLF